MAKYGFGTYGIPKYGEVDSNRLYYSSGIFGWSYDYQSISLTWKSILSDPFDAPYVPIAWRLVRSYIGVPDNPYVGDVLDSGDLPSNFRLSYLDTDSQLLENHEVTYTIWVFTASVDGSGVVDSYDLSKWINCGSTTVNTVAQTTTAEYFKRWLPAAWLNETVGTGDAVGESEDTELSRVVDAYSFAYDKIKVQATLLQEYANSRNIPSTLLKNKITDLGFLYEPSLGDTYHRSLYRTGNLINAIKGTTAGITTYATALTHWGTSVTIGKNLMLDYNDSSFEESVGRWKNNVRSSVDTTGAYNSATKHVGWTLTQQKYSTSLADLGVAITPPTHNVYDTSYPPRSSGFMRLKRGATSTNGSQSLTLCGWWSDLSPTLYGIPVDPTKDYTFSGWVRSTAARTSTIANYPNLLVNVVYFDKTGTRLGYCPLGGEIQNITNSWAYFSVNAPSGIQEDVIPAATAYFGLEMHIQGAIINDEFLFDMLQVAEKTGNYVYEDARLINVNIEADVENYILNPSFDSGTSWWQAYNADLVQDFNPPSTAKIFGTAVAKVTALSTDTAALISDWQTVESGTPYTVGFYVSGPVGRTAIVRLEYSSKQSYEDQIQILSDVDGSYYPTDAYYVDSAPLTLTATAQRASVYATSPVQGEDYSNPLVKSSVYFPNAQEGDVFYVDSVMMVETPVIKDYFQGNGGPVPSNPNTGVFYPTTDCTWDKRPQLNMVTNSSFDDTTKWTAASGTTLTSTTSTPLFGTKRGNVSATGGGEISTVVYYPNGACIGGEDVVVSAYVKNVAGTYSISTNGQTVNTFKLSSANASSWTRLHVNRIAEIGETNFTITISLSDAGSGTKVFHIDGVQAEFGRVATPFIDPAVSTTVVSTNPAQSGETVSSAYSYMVNAGYSFYGARYVEKYQRLASSLNLVTPLGSSWAIITHPSKVELNEITGTLLPSPSFELNLDGWNGVASSLKRSISRGTIFDEILTQGASFCKVTSTAATSFGIITDLIDIEPVTGYYTSIAIKPENEDAYGKYTLKLKWYAESQGFLREKISELNINRHDRWAYLDIVAPGSRTIAVEKAQVVGNYVTLTTTGEHKFTVGEELTVTVNEFPTLSGNTTIEALTPTTFSFTKASTNIAETTVAGAARFSNTGVSYAKIEVVCEPTNAGIGRTFHLDKVIFKE